MKGFMTRPLLAALLLSGLSYSLTGAATQGGSQITNSATATYQDAAHREYATSSNAVTATVAKLAAIVVSPKETAPIPASETAPVGQPTVRTFVVTNASNISDAYRITALTAATLAITSIAWIGPNGAIPTTIAGPISPQVAPGASIQVRVTIDTSGTAVGANVPVHLTAQTTVAGTVNGLQSDTGTEWIVGASPPKLVGPGGANTQVTKTVDRVTVVQSQPGATVTFSIDAMNSGGSAAQNVVISDTVPSGLGVDVSTATIDGQPAGAAATLQGQTITISVPTLAPGATLDVSFDASVPQNQTLGLTSVNVASISATGVSPMTTTPASVLAGAADIVFDGFEGGQHPVADATVTLLDANGQPEPLSAIKSTAETRTLAAVQGGMQNPDVTGSDGTYGFALAPANIAPAGSHFFLTIVAPNYLNRRIALDITPGAQGLLYNVTQTSLDGQPLAKAGSFTLTTNNVALQNVFGLFGNLPLFAKQTIDVTKSVDRQVASPGDRLLFTLAFANASGFGIGPTTVTDTLPSGMVYLDSSARLDGAAIEPAVSGRTLVWTLPSLDPGTKHVITYAATIFPGVAPGTNLTNTVVVRGQVAGTTLTTSGSATTTVEATSGVFTQRRALTGRVFIDERETGYFAKGDTGVPGVRVYLEDGSYVITDANGRFSIPAIRPGEHVLRLDPATLPKTVRTNLSEPITSNKSLQRLVHGIFDDASMQDIEFALEPKT